MNGTRHEWIDELCARLERVLVGRAADDLLAGELPDRAAAVLLPAWNWLPPKIDMGRKTLRADGDQMLMPVRVTWSSTCLLLDPPDYRQLAGWLGIGLVQIALGAGIGLLSLPLSRARAVRGFCMAATGLGKLLFFKHFRRPSYGARPVPATA